MFIVIVFYYALTFSSPVSSSSQDFFCSLSRDQSLDVTSRLGVSVTLKCTSFAFMQLISGYYFYDYRCAEALVDYRSSLLNRHAALQTLSKL